MTKIKRLKKLFEEPLNISFTEAHKQIEKIMERPVWTHEMAFPKYLYKELEEKTKGSAFTKSLQKISETKTVIIIKED